MYLNVSIQYVVISNHIAFTPLDNYMMLMNLGIFILHIIVWYTYIRYSYLYLHSLRQ